MNRTFAPIILAVLLAVFSCGRKTEVSSPEHHYQLSGEVLSLNAKDQTATVKHGPIANWMDAMTMEYPIKSKADFTALRVGERIRATVDVRGDADYSLSNIQNADSGK